MWDQANKRFSWFAKGIGAKRITTAKKFQCGADTTNKTPVHKEVMSVMWRTGLPEPVLQAIWESVSPSNPEQLTRQEFYSCLVLIALAQRNLTIADLSFMKTLPIPTLSSIKPKELKLNFKKNENKSKPNGHLLKTVHPLFTEQNVKVDGDLIMFDGQSTSKNVDLELYPSTKLNPEDICIYHQKLAPHWESVLLAASEVFSAVKQTNSATVEVFKTEQGFRFVRSLNEIQRVLRNIHKNATSIPNVSSDLVSKCEILFAVWANLLNILEEDSLMLDLVDEFEKTGHMCNICGDWTNVNNTHFDKDTELSYHIPCANLWLNLVNSTLPRP
uniref:EH domain-containing protein n=1 Tax=Bursaphelenchus xylophilus TaxID=6326 RepID=A0A1I7STK3_BURXY